MRVIAIQRGVHVRVSIVSENTPLATETTTEETVTPVKEESLTVEV